MNQRTIFQAALFPEYCPSLRVAEEAAMREAADTGGIILKVRSLRIEPSHIIAAGVIPAAALAFERPSEFPAHLRPRSVGSMRVANSSLSDPTQNDEFGYLVLQTPVVATGQVPESEDGDSIWVTVSVPQATAALEPRVLGATCCNRCNRPITRPRLLAIPNTRVCTNCQQKKETKC